MLRDRELCSMTTRRAKTEGTMWRIILGFNHKFHTHSRARALPFSTAAIPTTTRDHPPQPWTKSCDASARGALVPTNLARVVPCL